MGVPFLAGQRLTAADLNTATQQGAWTSYTPTWTDSGAAPAIGNGSLLGYYSKIGRVVTVRVNIVGGTTTTWGGGSFYNIGLPIAALVETGAQWFGTWHGWRVGTQHYLGTAFITSGASTMSAYSQTTNNIGPTTPATWATADQMDFEVTYETAS